jgi:hypothetical protein
MEVLWLDKERDHEYVHLISDNNKFVGISKSKLLRWCTNFKDVT